MPNETQEVTIQGETPSGIPAVLRIHRVGTAERVTVTVEENGSPFHARHIEIRADELQCAAEVICGEEGGS